MNCLLVENPALTVTTDRHPVMALHNKQTRVSRVAAVGEAAYADLVEQARRFTKGEVISTIAMRGAV